eukprot:8172543-Pyramimonas_sp.AAC.1
MARVYVRGRAFAVQTAMDSASMIRQSYVFATDGAGVHAGAYVCVCKRMCPYVPVRARLFSAQGLINIGLRIKGKG